MGYGAGAGNFGSGRRASIELAYRSNFNARQVAAEKSSFAIDRVALHIFRFQPKRLPKGNFVRAIILAAGRGSRMQSFTSNQPKCLVKVHGKCLLDRQLDAIRAAGINDIGIVTGYRRDALRSRGLVEFHNPRWAETQMIESLRFAEDWLDSSDCIISYSDIFYEASAVAALASSNENIALTFDPEWLNLWRQRFSDPLSDAETFRLDSASCVIEIGNTPTALDQIQGQFMGLVKLSPAGWHEICSAISSMSLSDRSKIQMTGVLQKVVDNGKIPVVAIPYDGEWGEVDQPTDLGVYHKYGMDL